MLQICQEILYATAELSPVYIWSLPGATVSLVARKLALTRCSNHY